MKQIFRFTVCLLVVLMAIGVFASCSPNNGEEEPVTTTTQVTTTVMTTTTQHGNLAASDVIVRSGPGLDYDAIGGISYDEDVTILGREGDWYQIQFGDQIGYISAQYVDVDDAPNASEMVESLKTTTVAKNTNTTKTGNTTGTVKIGDKTTTTAKVGDAVTTTTKVGHISAPTTTTTATGVVTTTTMGEGVPVVEGIPEDVVVDDF